MRRAVALSCRSQVLHGNLLAQALFTHLGFALLGDGGDAAKLRFQRALTGQLQHQAAC